jgi:hypothetical protein
MKLSRRCAAMAAVASFTPAAVAAAMTSPKRPSGRLAQFAECTAAPEFVLRTGTRPWPL